MTQILTNREQFMTLVPFDGNLDWDKIVPHLITAQRIWIQDKTGTKLLEKLIELVESGQINDSGNEKYKYILDTFIEPMLCYQAGAEVVRWHAFNVANEGVLRNNPVDTFAPSIPEVNVLAQSLNDKAGYLAIRFTSYMAFYSVQFPEWNSNVTPDVFPRYGAKRTGWLL